MTQEVESRPVNLAITKFSFPIPAVISILHRLSGIGLFFGSLYLIFMLVLSLRDEQSFAQVSFLLTLPIHKVIVWLISSMVIFHIVAGIRHLLLDFHIGTSLHAARRSSYWVLIISAVLVVVGGVWLFL